MHLVVHTKVPADDIGIAAMALLPVLIAQNEDRIGAHLVVNVGEESPQVGLDSEQIEEVR